MDFFAKKCKIELERPFRDLSFFLKYCLESCIRLFSVSLDLNLLSQDPISQIYPYLAEIL